MVQTVFITGGSRGVGLEIAKKFAKDGANIAFIGKTTEPQPKLPGTIYTAAEEIKAAGATDVMAIACDIRNLDELQATINKVGEKFGKIDIVVNNASALYLLNLAEITPSKFNLMNEIIVRGSLFTSQFALPYLMKSQNPRIINIAPKPILEPKWFKGFTAYTIFKYSSSMMVMGMAAEFAEKGIAVNAVWPATFLATAAVQNKLGGEIATKRSRHPKIVADAIHFLVQKSVEYSGCYHLDEDLIKEMGADLEAYSLVPGSDLLADIYVER